MSKRPTLKASRTTLRAMDRYVKMLTAVSKGEPVAVLEFLSARGGFYGRPDVQRFINELFGEDRGED